MSGFFALCKIYSMFIWTKNIESAQTARDYFWDSVLSYSLSPSYLEITMIIDKENLTEQS